MAHLPPAAVGFLRHCHLPGVWAQGGGSNPLTPGCSSESAEELVNCRHPCRCRSDLPGTSTALEGSQARVPLAEACESSTRLSTLPMATQQALCVLSMKMGPAPAGGSVPGIPVGPPRREGQSPWPPSMPLSGADPVPHWGELRVSGAARLPIRLPAEDGPDAWSPATHVGESRRFSLLDQPWPSVAI